MCVGGRDTSSVDGVGCMSWWTVTSLCSTVCVCVCQCVCTCVCACVCVHMCAGVVSKDASRVSAYSESDGLPRIGVLLKEGDPCYRWGWSPH